MMELTDFVAVFRTLGAWGVAVFGVGRLLQWMIERSDRRIELVIERLEREIVRLETQRDSLVRDRDRWRLRYLDFLTDQGAIRRRNDD